MRQSQYHAESPKCRPRGAIVYERDNRELYVQQDTVVEIGGTLPDGISKLLGHARFVALFLRHLVETRWQQLLCGFQLEVVDAAVYRIEVFEKNFSRHRAFCTSHVYVVSGTRVWRCGVQSNPALRCCP
jgi:hypothetical protein